MPTRKTRNFLGRTAEKLEEGFDSAKEKIDDTKEKAEETIKDNPWASIAIAAAVGAIVALGVSALVKRERKSFVDRFRDYFD